jgi:serine protease
LRRARSASIRRHRILALSLAAAVGTLAFASSPVLATTAAGDAAAGGRAAAGQNATATTVQDVAAGEAYTKFIVDYKESAANATPNGRANAWGKAPRIRVLP